MTLTLRPEMSAARDARRFVQRRLAAAPAEVRDTALLLVSELVTNAIQHAGTEIKVDVDVKQHSVRVTVLDRHEQRHLRPGLAPPDAVRGRGLFLLDQLADDWGVQPRPAGKGVWFELWWSGG